MEKLWRLLRRRPESELLAALPTTIQFSLTSACNLRCIMCHQEADWLPENFSTLLEGENNIFTRFLKIEPLLAQAIHLSLTGGGEPFLDPNLFKILEVTAKYPNCNTSFNTNGTIFSEEKIRRLIQYNLTQLDISLDSPNKGTFEKIRKKASFDQIIENIKRIKEIKSSLRSAKPKLVINMVVMRRNLEELPEMVGLVKDLGLDGLTVFYAQIYRKDLSQESISLYRDLVKEAMLKTYQEASRLKVELVEVISEPLGIKIDEKLEDSRIKRIGRPPCRFPWDNLYVFSNGNVRFCCYSSPILGNLDHQNLGEIWNGEKAQEVRRIIASGGFPRECHHCYLWGKDRFFILDKPHWIP
jgi:MoaA/NifB/PqqE/SkfB family radical SAM enzyme